MLRSEGVYTAPATSNNVLQWLIVAYSIVPASFYKDFKLVVESISILISEGAQFAAPATLQIFVDRDQAAPQNAASNLIVIHCNSKISLHFSEDCKICCEGDFFAVERVK
jgi:hypothetical protein